VVLLSHVTLYLEAGATLLGSKNLDDYASQAGPGAHADANQNHLVYARGAEDVGLAGPGAIDGQGPSFWVPSGRKAPPASDSWRDVATYDWKPLQRPSPMLEFVECSGLRIEDVRIHNAPGWTMRPINCDDVVIRGIAIKNPVIGPNTDGIDATGCQNLFISDCLIQTGDDALCLKSENPYGEVVRVSKNITVTNCVLTCCCNGFKFGTATRGSFENITFSNSVIYNNEDSDLRARVIAGIAVEMVDGGSVDGVVVSNIRMQNVRTPIFIRRGNRHPRPDGTPGTLRGVMIENVYATGSILTSSVTGLPGFDVEDVTLSNIRIDSQEAGKAEWAARTVPEVAKDYPEARMFGRLPAYGLYCRHVTGLRLKGIELSAATKEERPSVVCDDVKSLDIDGLSGTSVTGDQPAVKFVDVQKAFLRGCVAPDGISTFLDVQGGKSQNIALVSSDLRSAGKVVETAPEGPAGALSLAGNVTKA
jgi:polygalacturonase